jgi:hypothetical protein
MKAVRLLSALFVWIILASACEKEQILPDARMADQSATLKGAPDKSIISLQATGSLELIWKGATKGSDAGNKPDELQVFFEFDAHEGKDGRAPKGEVVYWVLDANDVLHREIRAIVYDVKISSAEHKGWILATVVSDSKGCSGNGQDGHDSGCSSGGHDDTGGGCSHDDTGGDDGSTHDEGCSHDDTGGESGGGCSGTDDHEGGMGGTPGGGDKGNPVSGKNCRLGQVIALKVHDVGTPGTNGDGITWKWFDPELMEVPSIDNVAAWPHLCKKTIIGGNLVVHTRP